MIVHEMSKLEAADLVRHCLEDGKLIPGSHFRRELADEGISFEDAYRILKLGTVYGPPEEDIRTGEWKYRIEGHEPGGKWIVIVFSFKAIDTVFLITVFSVKVRRR